MWLQVIDISTEPRYNLNILAEPYLGILEPGANFFSGAPKLQL